MTSIARKDQLSIQDFPYTIVTIFLIYFGRLWPLIKRWVMGIFVDTDALRLRL